MFGVAVAQRVTPAQARNWARVEAAREHLVALGKLIAPIRLMPLKGIELVCRYGVPGTDRAMIDFDALVEPGKFDEVVRKLRDAHYQMISSNFSTKVMLAPGGFIAVDVHRMPLPPMMGRWGAHELFRRGEARSDVYGFDAVHARPADFFVLLLANCLKDQLPDERAASMLRDVTAVASKTSPEAVRSAARDARLCLVSWIALTWLARTMPGFSLHAFRDALEPSRSQRMRAEISLSALPRWREPHRELAYALARSNADGLWRGAASAVLSFVRAGRDQARRWKDSPK